MASDYWQEFWSYIDELVSTSSIVIDRPQGSHHPRYPELVYPYDYGYLEGTLAMDGGGIDVWVGSLDSHVPGALILTVDLKKRDTEMKVLLGCTEVELGVIVDFLNSYSMRGVLVRRQHAGFTLIQTRRSVRRFLPKPVSRDMLERILEAATWAPSAHNCQPWRFAVLTSLEARLRLVESMGADFRRDLVADGVPPADADARVARSRRRILDAPVAITLCCDPSEMQPYSDPSRQQAEYLMGVQSVAMAGENLLLAAHAEGLGGVWMCAPLFTPETVRRALNLPVTWQPQGLVLIGYPEITPEPRPRRPVADVSVFL